MKRIHNKQLLKLLNQLEDGITYKYLGSMPLKETREEYNHASFSFSSNKGNNGVIIEYYPLIPDDVYCIIPTFQNVELENRWIDLLLENGFAYNMNENDHNNILLPKEDNNER